MGSSRLAASAEAVSAGGQEAAVPARFSGLMSPPLLGEFMSTSTGTGRSAEGRGLEGTPSTASYTNSAPAHAEPRRSTETKASFKTTELMAYIAAVVGVLVASAAVGTTHAHIDYFRADKAWFYIVLLTIAYMVSRGLAKSGSREHYNAS
jgi:hypothetical protein